MSEEIDKILQEIIKSNWNQIYTMICVNASIVALFAGWITGVINRVDSDVKKIGIKLDIMSSRMDSRLESHSARIDQLYVMFVDLLKEKK